MSLIFDVLHHHFISYIATSRYHAWSIPITNLPTTTSQPHMWNAYTAWGQVYEAADMNGVRLNSATNSRVQLKDMRSFYLSRTDGKWHVLQATRDVDGAAYNEDFSANTNVAPNLRYEPDGTVSVVPGDGYNFHFWPSGDRAVFTNPSDVAGIFVTVKARLIVDDPALPDDRALAKFVMDVGGDYWYDQYAEWDNWKTNWDLGMSRFKMITSTWQSFNMYSLEIEDITQSAAFIKSNPPPIE